MNTSTLDALIHARSANGARDLAARGSEGCRQLSDAVDAAVRSLVAPHPVGAALVAIGAYGRRELLRYSGIDVLVVSAGDVDEMAMLLDAVRGTGIDVRSAARSVEDLARGGVEVDALIDYLDARLVGGDEQVFRRFVEVRQQLVHRSRTAIKSEIVRRHHARIDAEPWQLQEPNIVRSRGGLDALRELRVSDLIEVIARRAGDVARDVTVPLLAEHETLLRALSGLHAFSDEPGDRWRLDRAEAIGELLGTEPIEVTRELLLAMRHVDEASILALDSKPESRWRRWGRKLLPPSPPAPDTPVADLEQLLVTLRAARAGGLDPLPRSERIERLLPDWDALRGRPHSAPFHQHPVDVHTMRTVVETARALVDDVDGMGTPLVARELANDDLVLLAALVHDLGQAHPAADAEAGAILADRFAARVGLDVETAQRLAQVTALHQLLATVASRRDISEPAVIAEVADAVGDSTTLHLLYLVSIADARAAGPDTWNSWKAALMRTLYVRVLAHLRVGAPEAASAAAFRREAVLSTLHDRFPRAAIERHIDALSPRYLLAISPETIGDHIALIEAANGDTAMRHDRAGEMERLTIVTHDRPGILSQVAGALAVHDVSVLGGNAYTRDDGVAIEVMHVTDALGGEIAEDRWARVCEDIALAIKGELDIDARLRAARSVHADATRPHGAVVVHVDNSGAQGYSVIEVNAGDRVGLLYAITRALHELRLDIHLAKVDTFGAEVVDAFHVLRENGRRVEAPDEIERVRQRIISAVHTLDAADGDR